MSVIKITAFNGMTPRTDPRLVEGNVAQSAINAKLQNGSIKPYKAPSQVAALQKTGTIKGIYRFGQEVVGDANYWFHWTTDVNVVKGPVAADDFERTYWTGDGVPKMTTNAIALTGGTNYPMNSYILGVPAPASTLTASLTGTGSGVPESRVYAYTYVSALGEEGPPSPVSEIISVQVGQSVVLSGMSVAPSGNYNITSKRIYRSVAGSSGSDYLFVAEIPVANSTYTDAILADSLGEVMPSKTWIAPPTDMAGLTLMANGILTGFSKNDICFSEPFVPHAWPSEYRLQTDYPIVGIGAFGASLFVGTNGYPYIINGVDPMGMTMTKGEYRQACVSKRSIVEMGNGVIYASPDGICAVDGSGIVVITKSIMTRDDWQAYKPESIIAANLDGRYFAFFDTGTRQGCLVLDMIGDGAQLWESSVYTTAIYNEIKTDSLYIVDGSNVKKWDGGTTNLSYTWRSKIFVAPRPENMGVGQVYAESYPVTFKLYADGALKHTQTVANDRPFKLPSGYKAKEYEAVVEGTAVINSIYIASTASDLKQA
jgi:hypothetical protein